jgi:hypothetical protein
MFRLLVPILFVTLSFGRPDLEQLTQRCERRCRDNVYPLADASNEFIRGSVVIDIARGGAFAQSSSSTVPYSIEG